MSAKRNEPRLYARPYIDPSAEPPKPFQYRLADFIEADARGVAAADVKAGERGLDISNLIFAGLQRRDLTADGNAGFLGASKQPTTAVEYFGSVLACSRAGAVTIPVDAHGFSPIPRVVDPGAGYWISEGVAPTESNMTFGSIGPSMKNCAANIDYPRTFPVVAGKWTEELFTRELFALIVRTVDKAALHGLGSTGEPTGVENYPGIKSIDGGTFTATKCADLINGPEAGNADTSALTAIIAPDVAELLRVRAENGTGSRFILSGGKLLNEIPVIVSNSVSAGCLFVADFSKMILLQRSLELMVDPYTQSKAGTIEMTIFWNGDVILTHPAAFAIAYSVT